MKFKKGDIVGFNLNEGFIGTGKVNKVENDIYSIKVLTVKKVLGTKQKYVGALIAMADKELYELTKLERALT